MAATAPADDRPDNCPSAAAASSPPQPTPEELVARAVAPVKPAFLRPPPVREAPSEENRATGAVPLEKKSKRQFKRERKQVTRSGGRQVLALLPQCDGQMEQCVPGACCNARVHLLWTRMAFSLCCICCLISC